MQSNGKKLDVEYITIINELGSEYMCHALSLGRKAEDIYNAIINNISGHTNIGHKTGINSRLERKIEKNVIGMLVHFLYYYFKYYNKF